MGTIGWFILFVVIVVVGNYLIRVIVKIVEGAKIPDKVKSSPHVELFTSKQEYELLLSSWGKQDSNFVIPKEYLPLHEDIVNLISNYKAVYSHELAKEYDRSYLVCPYKHNSCFIQIGLWGDGSEILVRKNSYDPKVYIADIEECMPNNPRVIATSVEAYFRFATIINESAKELEPKMRRKIRGRNQEQGE